MSEAKLMGLFQIRPAIDGTSTVKLYYYKEDDFYDIFDQDGECLNEGTPFYFRPTFWQIKEFLETGEIAEIITRIPN